MDPDPTASLGGPTHITVDCRDPQRLAAFWSDLTGQPIGHVDGPFVFLSAPSRELCAMAFQRVDVPTPGKNRIHVDFRTRDLTAARTLVERLGGQVVDERAELGARWLVASDPEGNLFCLVEASAP